MPQVIMRIEITSDDCGVSGVEDGRNVGFEVGCTGRGRWDVYVVNG